MNVEDLAKAEATLLVNIFRAPQKIYEISEVLRPEHFQTPMFAAIYTAMLSLASEGQDPSELLVTAKLTKDSLLELAGGKDFISQLANRNDVETHESFQGLTEVLIDGFLWREGVKIGHRLVSMKSAPQFHLGDAYTDIGKLLASNTASKIEPIEVTVERVKQDLLTRKESPGLPGYNLGYRELNFVTGGAKPGDLIVIAGRPGMGKTALLLNILVRLMQDGVRCMLFSQEMTREQVIRRITAMLSQVPLTLLERGEVDDEGLSRAFNALDLITSWEFIIDPSMSINAAYLRTAVQKFTRLGYTVFGVDFVQLMAETARSSADKVIELGRIIRTLKQVAVSEEVTIFALSQLNRQVEQRGNKRPQLADIRSSGEIEEYADGVWGLHCPDVYDDDAPAGKMELLVLKNRNGPSEIKVDLFFDRPYMSIREYVGR